MTKSKRNYLKPVTFFGKIGIFVLSLTLLFAFSCCQNTIQLLSVAAVAIFITVPAFFILFLEEGVAKEYPKITKYTDILRAVCTIVTILFILMIIGRFIGSLFGKF